MKAAGEVSPPSRSLTGPGQAPALGLRAEDEGVFILSQTSLRKDKHHVALFLVVQRALAPPPTGPGPDSPGNGTIPAPARGSGRSLAPLAGRPDRQLAGRLRAEHPSSGRPATRSPRRSSPWPRARPSASPG